MKKFSRAWIHGRQAQDTDGDGKPDSTKIRDKISPADKQMFERMSIDEMANQLTHGGTIMGGNFRRGNQGEEPLEESMDDAVVIHKSEANKELIAEMMSRQFGYSPTQSFNNMSSVYKSKANLHAIDHGGMYELHQNDGGQYIIAPIGYGSVGDLALPVPSEYAAVFETEIAKAKVRADISQKAEMRKSFSEVDSQYFYRKEMDGLLAKTYRLTAAKAFSKSACPKCGGAMHNGQCSKCGFAKSPTRDEYIFPTAEQRRDFKRRMLLTDARSARRRRESLARLANGPGPNDPPIVVEPPHEILKQRKNASWNKQEDDANDNSKETANLNRWGRPMQRSLSSERRFFKAVQQFAESNPEDPDVQEFMDAHAATQDPHDSDLKRDAAYSRANNAREKLQMLLARERAEEPHDSDEDRDAAYDEANRRGRRYDERYGKSWRKRPMAKDITAAPAKHQAGDRRNPSFYPNVSPLRTKPGGMRGGPPKTPRAGIATPAEEPDDVNTEFLRIMGRSKFS